MSIRRDAWRRAFELVVKRIDERARRRSLEQLEENAGMLRSRRPGPRRKCRHPKSKVATINDQERGLRTVCLKCGEVLSVGVPLRSRPFAKLVEVKEVVG